MRRQVINCLVDVQSELDIFCYFHFFTWTGASLCMMLILSFTLKYNFWSKELHVEIIKAFCENSHFSAKFESLLKNIQSDIKKLRDTIPLISPRLSESLHLLLV